MESRGGRGTAPTPSLSLLASSGCAPLRSVTLQQPPRRIAEDTLAGSSVASLAFRTISAASLRKTARSPGWMLERSLQSKNRMKQYLPTCRSVKREIKLAGQAWALEVPCGRGEDRRSLREDGGCPWGIRSRVSGVSVSRWKRDSGGRTA